MLHLDHRALAGAIRRLDARRRGYVYRRLDVREQALERLASPLKRLVTKILFTQREQIPGDERSGPLRGEQLHARRGRVDAEEQSLETEPLAADDDDLPVDHAALGQPRGQRRRTSSPSRNTIVRNPSH